MLLCFSACGVTTGSFCSMAAGVVQLRKSLGAALQAFAKQQAGRTNKQQQRLLIEEERNSTYGTIYVMRLSLFWGS